MSFCPANGAVNTAVSYTHLDVYKRQFYNYILSKIEGLTSEMEDSSITLLDMITKYNLKYKK